MPGWLAPLVWLRDLLAGLLGGGDGDALARLEADAAQLRRTNTRLKLRLLAKEEKIRDLEKRLAERDPGALFDSVFVREPSPAPDKPE